MLEMAQPGQLLFSSLLGSETEAVSRDISASPLTGLEFNAECFVRDFILVLI